jgi:small subunit ribosomal protein S16
LRILDCINEFHLISYGGGEPMATKIRLRRMGAKKRPFYRIVVADARSPRDGRFIEEIGYYDPTTTPATIKIDEEKALKWLTNGAKPSDTVKSILQKQGVIAKFTASRK